MIYDDVVAEYLDKRFKLSNIESVEQKNEKTNIYLTVTLRDKTSYQIAIPYSDVDEDWRFELVREIRKRKIAMINNF